MARWTPVPVAGGAYSDDTKPWSIQDTVNRLPVAAERQGARSEAILRDCPGLSVLAEVGSSAVRGLHSAEGLLLAVVGQSLYKISADGTVSSVGTIPGVGRVSMAHNQITGGNQVIIANGLSGYVYNTKTNALAQVSDAGFPGAKVVDFVDGYIAFVEPGGRYWGISNLADATDYNTLDRSEAESQPDKIVSLIVSHREVMVLGERTCEFYGNTGAATGTFQRKDGTEIEVGCAGTFAVAKLDNTVFWLGDDGIVYRLAGYQPQRISTHAIEQAISRCVLSAAYATTFEDRGHKVFYLTFTDGQTWGYDVASGEWHRRKSYGRDFWRVNHLTRWNGVWVGGDYTNGKLYQLDWALSNEAGEPLERSRTFAVMHDSGNRLHVNAVRLFYDTGRDALSPPLPVSVLPSVSVTGDLGDGVQGDTESYQYTASGGLGPYTYTVLSGALPDGLSMDTAGLVTGTRTTAGGYSWVVQATDTNGNTATVADSSMTTSAEIYTWTARSGPSGQAANAAYVSGDIIAIGHNNNVVSYSTNRGVAWSTAVAHPTALNVTGLVKFGADWYCFGQSGGVYRASKATGDTFTFSDFAITFQPWSSGINGNAAFVHGAYLYVAVRGTGAANFKLARFDGTTWTTIDTGIADAANHGICSHAVSGGYHIFGTSDGRVLRSADLATFAVVATLASGEVSVAALGATVLAANSTGSLISRSTDNGATFAAGYLQGKSVIANNYHFICANADKVYTSMTGADGSWTQRLDALLAGSGVRGAGYGASTLACWGTYGSYAYVGDIA